jgi:hypothetical protein
MKRGEQLGTPVRQVFVVLNSSLNDSISCSGPLSLLATVSAWRRRDAQGRPELMNLLDEEVLCGCA